MTKTQIDRLGERLRGVEIDEADLRALEDYRRSFAAAYEQVMRVLSDRRLQLTPTGREKTTLSISQKLRRGPIRLSQIDDVMGCRVVVSDLLAQGVAVMQIEVLLEHTTIKDRRERPSHGYRAVHVIAKIGDRSVEIQVRTALQHWWAEWR